MSRRTVSTLFACGVAAVYCCSSASAQLRLDLVGLHGGAIVRSAENSEMLVGPDLRFLLGERLILAVALQVRTDFPNDPTGAWNGTALWAPMTIRVPGPRPFGFVSVGAGVAVGWASAHDAARDVSGGHTTLREVVVAGLDVHLGRIRPMVDLHLVDAIRSPTEPSSHLTIGVGLGIGGSRGRAR